MRNITITEKQIESWRQSWSCSGLDGCKAIVVEFTNTTDYDFEIYPQSAEAGIDGYALNAIILDAIDGKLS